MRQKKTQTSTGAHLELWDTQEAPTPCDCISTRVHLIVGGGGEGGFLKDNQTFIEAMGLVTLLLRQGQRGFFF